ncbi:hypothetical protein M431DRAFT_505285 [Trichoderma harzianum CBS 226.95]|uniref:Cyanovirin-N domain-containing protein n=1 Tax=Trichoderma harzianum CBS 226.95 TaxID=983964 RepID=A0A2T4AKY0_TRIHA|nr:hypothetical protein M431DRAFT_505285 [Trichoderma harzianum CBS 226.95]PTB57707.1 hypothetical protein M431DRAFT_505285 [Trichoderma harzianum CBS 226.95]
MKYSTATLFAAAAALVSITSASDSVSAECDHELGICPVLPATPLQIPQDHVLDDLPPCVEVIVRHDNCRIDPVRIGPITSVISDAYHEASVQCNCIGTDFAAWLDCQSCILESGLADDDVNQIWLQILAGAQSLICNSYQPTDPYGPTQTTPAPVFTTYNPTTTTTYNFGRPTRAPLDANEVKPQVSCAEEASMQQGLNVTTATALPTPTAALLPPVLTVSGASSLEMPGLALAIVGGLILGML